MNDRSKILDRAIGLHADAMSAYHGPRFADSCRRFLTHAKSLATVAEDGIAGAVALYAEDYMTGVRQERERILGIDAIASQMPENLTALAKRAKNEGLTADEFAVQALNSCRQFSHAMPARKQ